MALIGLHDHRRPSDINTLTNLHIMVSYKCRFDTIPACDSDRRTDILPTHSPCLCKASRGKNILRGAAIHIHSPEDATTLVDNADVIA